MRYCGPFGAANVGGDGDVVTRVTSGGMVLLPLDAPASLAGHGISCVVLDLPRTSPLVVDIILESVEKNGRLVVV
ncbi:transketolase C-terminal domain-containing protein, partial [Pseudomonas aeruginosa]